MAKIKKNDGDLNFVRIALDDKQKSCQDLERVCKLIDDMWSTDTDFKTKFFKDNYKLVGGKKDRFAYLESVKIPTPKTDNDDDDSDDDDKKKSKSTGDLLTEPRKLYNSLKAKLKVNFQTKKIETAVFMMEGKVPKKQNIETLEQLRTVFPWKSKAKFIISIPKFWFSLAEDTMVKKKKMGVTFRIEQIFITEQGGGSGSKRDFSNSLFGMISNDDDDTYNAEKSTKSTKKITNSSEATKESTKESSKKKPVVETSDSEEEETKKGNDTSDSSSSDDEDEKPKRGKK